MGKPFFSRERIRSPFRAASQGRNERYYYSVRMRRQSRGWAEALGLFTLIGLGIAGVSAAAEHNQAPSIYVVDRASPAVSHDVAVIYRKCAAVSSATPIFKIRPIFASKIDRDGDGLVC